VEAEASTTEQTGGEAIAQEETDAGSVTIDVQAEPSVEE
jgi:hypothetical protein